MNKKNLNNIFLDTPQSFKNMVRDTLDNLPEKRGNSEMEDRKVYKKVSAKKKIIAALVATMALGTTVFAAGKILSIVGNSSNIPIYTDMPTDKEVKEDFGFEPKLVDKFSNGYVFENGYTTNYEGIDEEGSSLEKSKTIDFVYKNGKDKINLSMQEGILGEKSNRETVVDTYKGIEIYYNVYKNKLVPGDYEMTEQDKKDELSGKYVFSYGSKEIEVSEVKYLNWKQNGIYYNFLVRDGNLSQDELVKMAHEVIDTK